MTDDPGDVVRSVFQCLNDHDLDRYPGESFEVEICGVVKVRDGKIATWNFYSQQVPLPGADR